MLKIRDYESQSERSSSPTAETDLPVPHTRSPLQNLRNKFEEWCRILGVALFKGALLLLVLNLILYGIMAARRPTKTDDPLGWYGLDKLQMAYPGWRKEDVNTLLLETWRRNPEVEYEPFTEFREVPFRGKFVNID